jgi:hypothetical protein
MPPAFCACIVASASFAEDTLDITVIVAAIGIGQGGMTHGPSVAHDIASNASAAMRVDFPIAGTVRSVTAVRVPYAVDEPGRIPEAARAAQGHRFRGDGRRARDVYSCIMNAMMTLSSQARGASDGAGSIHARSSPAHREAGRVAVRRGDIWWAEFGAGRG